MNFIKTVNQTPLPTDLLIEANMRHAKLSSEDRKEMAAWTIEFIRLVEEKGYTGKEAQDVHLSIQFRMTALSRLMMNGRDETKGWSFPGKIPGLVFAHEELFQIAAIHPLIENNDQAIFADDSFFKALLEITETKGRA